MYCTCIHGPYKQVEQVNDIKYLVFYCLGCLYISLVIIPAEIALNLGSLCCSSRCDILPNIYCVTNL